MSNIKLIFIIIFITILGGCASPDPMRTPFGPINTPAFEPIVLDVVKDGSKNVRFKEAWTGMYENKKFYRLGVFFITDNGAYLVAWNMRDYKYTLQYKLSAKDIELITDDIVERNLLPDLKLLVLSDKNGRKVGFDISEKYMARLILEEIMRK